MSAVLAHEIRNPLGTIKGFAQLLGERLDGRHSELLEPVLSETIAWSDWSRTSSLRPAADEYSFNQWISRRCVETIRGYAPN